MASGFIASESVRMDNFTLPTQVFGREINSHDIGLYNNGFKGLVNSTNVTLKNEVSGVLGMGFPRLSLFSSLTVNGKTTNVLYELHGLRYPQLLHLWITWHNKAFSTTHSLG